MSTNYSAVKGRQLEVAVIHTSATTALTLGSFTLKAMHDGAYVADPTTDWSLALSEVDAANLPGWYRLVITPPTTGTFSLNMVNGAHDETFILQAAHEALDLLGAELYGAESDYVITVDDGADPIESVDVRVFDAAGVNLKARGTTDVLGQVTFGLPTGSYETRYSKEAYDFSSSNPTTITVDADEGVAPVILEILPTTAAEGDRIAVMGRYFSATSEVLFDGNVETIVGVSSDDQLVLAPVSTGLSNTLVQVQVRKPDPDNPGEYLSSGTLTLVKS